MELRVSVRPYKPTGPATLYKQCECSPATASGPRAIARFESVDGYVEISMEMVGMACDRCEREWLPTKPAGAKGG